MFEIPFTTIGHYIAIHAQQQGIKIRRPINNEWSKQKMEEAKKFAEEMKRNGY